MKILALLSLLLIPFAAKAIDSPLFPKHLWPTQETLESSGPHFSKSQIKYFRVLIFPHFGTYTIPQGREASASSVTITSDASCKEYVAVLDENREWVKSGALISESSRMHLTTANLTSSQGEAAPKYFECSTSFVVNRIQPLRSLAYSGNFVAMISGKTVQIINVIDPDTYIEGVVPAEVESAWPEETLKAQAVAARSYAWWCVLDSRGKNPNYDMDDTVFFQAYLGNFKRTLATDEATRATQGLLMKYNHQVIKAYFSSDSGGFTESALSAFGDNYPYCSARAETYDLSQITSQWAKSISLAKLQSELVKAHFFPFHLTLRKVWVKGTDRTESGRANRVSFLGSDGATYSVSGNDFRYLIHLRSNLFELSTSSGNLNIQGKGFGHGVGMAQLGALQYSKEMKWSFEEILHFYYKDITLEE